MGASSAPGPPGGGLGALPAESPRGVREAPSRTESASPQPWPLPRGPAQPGCRSRSRGGGAYPWPKLSAPAALGPVALLPLGGLSPRGPGRGPRPKVASTAGRGASPASPQYAR